MNKIREKIILGTVQQGKKYGITNFFKKPDKKNIFKILSLAINNNINKFDTAPSYNTEKLLGNFIKTHGLKDDVKIYTKIPSIKNRDINSFIRLSIEKSMKNLNCNIDTLFFMILKIFQD